MNHFNIYLPLPGVSEKRVTAIGEMMRQMLKAKPASNPLSQGEYIKQVTPLWIYKAWGYNATNDCNEKDYLGGASKEVRKREQQPQDFKDLSLKVNLLA